MKSFDLKVGFENFNDNSHLNYRINVWYAIGCLSYEEAKQTGTKIKNFKDWKHEFVEMGKKAEVENRLFSAAFCYRIAEFHIPHIDPDKKLLYNKFQELYYKEIEGSYIEKHLIPYEGSYLPALRISASSNKKGVFVIHGGYDSDMEDFHNLYGYLTDRGYEIIAFEGPGQGAAIHKYHLKLIYEWEKPTTAVLDYFGLNNVTLLGISLGGYLALRAAAYEPRIKRVVLCDIIWDLLGAIFTNAYSSEFKERVFDMLKRESRQEVDALEKEMIVEKKDVFMTWLYQHGCFILGVNSLYDYFQEMLKYNTRNISPLVKQDVLLLAGQDDLYTMYYEDQKKALTHANSVEGRIFTREEQASHHCQIDNLPLMLDYVLDWVNKKSL